MKSAAKTEKKNSFYAINSNISNTTASIQSATCEIENSKRERASWVEEKKSQLTP
jgi:hypothetical protein